MTCALLTAVLEVGRRNRVCTENISTRFHQRYTEIVHVHIKAAFVAEVTVGGHISYTNRIPAIFS